MASTKPMHAAPSPATLMIILMAIAVHGVYSSIIKCEELPVEVCAFSVSSSGNRCVLEKALMMDGTVQFLCQSSVVMAEKLVASVETEECSKACGLERMTVGMSTDFMFDPEFVRKLCSSECRNNCPNIVDLYDNLAAGEGISFPSMCKSQQKKSQKKSRSRYQNEKSVSGSSKSKSSIDSKDHSTDSSSLFDVGVGLL